MLPRTRSGACLALQWPFAPPSTSTAATIRPRRRREWLGAKEIGEMGCLDAGQSGERIHAVGFAGGVTVGELWLAGATPCSTCV
jgi:hypothetical protein